jgi:hypothetical protein
MSVMMQRHAEANKYGSLGGNTRQPLVVPVGWTSSEAIPADCHIAEMKVCTDHEGYTRKLFRIVLKPSVVQALSDKAKKVILEMHSHNVRATDRELLRRKHFVHGLQ